jgi:membrane-associated phospholipid phosphatase
VTPTPPVDESLFAAVQELARSTPWLHGVIVGYARYGVVLFAGLLVLSLLAARRRSDRDLAAAGWAGLATLLAVAANQPVGALVGEERPYATHPGALLLLSPTADHAFPSDHAVMAGAAAVGLLIAARRLGWWAVGAALIMAFARVYVGAHYPQDVLAGLALGGLVAGVGWWLLRAALTEVTHRVRALPLVSGVFGPAEHRPVRA